MTTGGNIYLDHAKAILGDFDLLATNEPHFVSSSPKAHHMIQVGHWLTVMSIAESLERIAVSLEQSKGFRPLKKVG